MTYCAICADVITGAPARLPLGRNDALVNVCATCDEEPVRSRTGPILGYTAPERDAGRGTTASRFAAAANRVAGAVPIGHRKRGSVIASASPGFIVVRVARKDATGQPIDSREARRSLRDRPWANQLRALGTDVRWHIFERPDSEAASADRAGGADPLAGMERYRVGGDGLAK